MKILVSLMLLWTAALAGCATDTSDPCVGDHCVCVAGDTCDHTCATGAAECHIQGAPNEAVNATCSNNAQCHVECEASSSCRVACGGSSDCNVTCPATGCTVTGCVGEACAVTCGLTGAIATRSGTTATCP